MDSVDVAIVGAEGLIGQELLKILEERQFPASSVRLFDADRRPGGEYFFRHQRLEVEETSADAFRAVDVLHLVNRIRRIVVSTYQPVSCSGTAAALKELTAQAKRVLEGRRVCPHLYSHQIAFNVLPEIDVFLDNGYTKEEWRIVEETRRILRDESIGVSPTCVRVPVYFGQSQSVNVEFESAITPEEARKALAQAPGVRNT
jgi:aspartate-semialdehyde dehydrogenase